MTKTIKICETPPLGDENNKNTFLRSFLPDKPKFGTRPVPNIPESIDYRIEKPLMA